VHPADLAGRYRGCCCSEGIRDLPRSDGILIVQLIRKGRGRDEKFRYRCVIARTPATIAVSERIAIRGPAVVHPHIDIKKNDADAGRRVRRRTSESDRASPRRVARVPPLCNHRFSSRTPVPGSCNVFFHRFPIGFRSAWRRFNPASNPEPDALSAYRGASALVTNPSWERRSQSQLTASEPAEFPRARGLFCLN